jgi:hypothetical protein
MLYLKRMYQLFQGHRAAVREAPSLHRAHTFHDLEPSFAIHLVCGTHLGLLQRSHLSEQFRSFVADGGPL